MRYKTFILLYLTALLIGLLLFFAFLKILEQFFEHNKYSQIVQYQNKHEAIYGSSLNENYFSYRLELIKAKKPEIVAIGSSRVGQFKQKYFNQSFIAAANGGNSLAETRYFIQEMLKFHKPKLIILGIDPWWFNKKMPNSPINAYQNIQGKEITASKTLEGIQILFSHAKFFIKALRENQTTQNPYTQFPSLGFRALIHSNGSFPDGSYLYFSTISGLSPQNIKFQDSKERIQKEIFPFYYGASIDSQRLIELQTLQRFIQDQQIKLLVIIAPLAPTIYKLLIEQTQYSYLRELSTLTKANHIYNFLNPNTLKTTDCEFYDGFHGGDIVYARMLQNIKESEFQDFFALKTINSTITHKSGRAYSDEILGYKEVDFLQIGCQK